MIEARLVEVTADRCKRMESTGRDGWKRIRAKTFQYGAPTTSSVDSSGAKQRRHLPVQLHRSPWAIL